MQIVVLILLIAIIVWLIYLSWQFIKLNNHYQKLISFNTHGSLKDILDSILQNIESNKKSLNEAKIEIAQIKTDDKFHLQKIGLLRFNPFSDTGGNHSFVLAILDNQETGVLLTSLHSRGITRWYAKNVKEGKGIDYDLSQEEIKIIKSLKERTHNVKQ